MRNSPAPRLVDADGPDEQVMLARARLSRLAEPGSAPVWAFVAAEGPVAAAEAIMADLAPQEVLRCAAARRATADPRLDLDAAHRHGIRLVVPESPDWPHFALGALDRAARRSAGAGGAGALVPPLALWVKGPGDLASLGTRSVALVGSRAATDYGEHVTATLGYGLARQGVVIVSGGAYGIDAAAHHSALAAADTTVIVSAAGLDTAYPAGNAELFARTSDRGLLISESPPGCAPQRHRFLTRNRLIAALSTGTVVVEAARRSGAANTAAHAFALGRVVMAVPGPVTSPMSAGCHALLRREPEAAVLVTGVDDVMALVGPIDAPEPSGASEPSGHPDGPRDLRAHLDRVSATARLVFDALAPRRWSGVAELSERSALSVGDIVRALPELDLAGLLDTSELGYRIASTRVAP